MLCEKGEHSVRYWLYQIKEIVELHNLLNQDNKLDFNQIEANIGDDLESAIKEYRRVQEIHVINVKEKFMRKGKRKTNNHVIDI